MKTGILLTLLILLPLAVSRVLAQDAASLILEGKALITEGYNTNDMDRIKQAQALFQRARSDEEHAPHALYYLGFAEYRLASLNQSTDQVVDHVNKGIHFLEKMLEHDEGNAEGQALLGSLTGWKAGIRPAQAMVLGPRSNQLFASARKADPDNPRIQLLVSISDYNKPAMFGGDKEQALAGFHRATQLFEERPETDPLLPSWGHADAYAWIGLIQMEFGRNTEAKAALDNALDIDPDHGWVNYVLMPQLTAN